MTRSTLLAALALAAAGFTCQAAEPALKFNDKGELARPADYREWVFLTAGLGMTYGPNAPRAGQPAPFSNVFVNPDSYREFMQTGKWPNGTMFILEIRRSATDNTLVKGGRYQSDLAALEAEVKDSRFSDGWGFFNWGSARALKDVTEPLPATAGSPGEESCVECHTKHTAVERTFVQFYPQLLEVARQKGTLKPGF